MSATQPTPTIPAREAQGPPADGGKSDSRPAAVAYLVAALLLAAYLVLLFLQWFDVGADDKAWARRLQLVNALEALAVAGAGLLLGATAQRQATRREAKRANEERARADANQAAAEGGRAMAKATRAKLRAASDGGRYETRGLGQQPSHPVASELSELADLAEQYEL